MGRKHAHPSEETVAAPRDGEPILDIEFDRTTAAAMLRKGNISEARWERIQKEVDIRDLLETLYPEKHMVSNKISCPFHGADRTPSFTVYPRTNSANCFGCPDKDGYWDSVKIVARTMEISTGKAVAWIEKEWDLPPLDEGEEEEVTSATEETVYLSVEDLSPTFEQLVGDYTILHRNEPEDIVGEAREAIDRFFRSHFLKDALPLARLIGAQRVNALRSARVKVGVD